MELNSLNIYLFLVSFFKFELEILINYFIFQLKFEYEYFELFIFDLIHVEFGIKLIFKLIITVLRVNLRKYLNELFLSGKRRNTRLPP